VDALLNSVGDSDGEVRAAAIRALAATDPAAAMQPSLVCLEDPLPEVRCQAIRALMQGGVQQAGVIEKVRSLGDDPQPAVRSRVAVAMVIAGDLPSALAILYKLAADPDPEVRLLAVRAAGECWGAEKVDHALFLPVIADAWLTRAPWCAGPLRKPLQYRLSSWLARWYGVWAMRTTPYARKRPLLWSAWVKLLYHLSWQHWMMPALEEGRFKPWKNCPWSHPGIRCA